MANIVPKTFYEWLMELNRLKLKAGPLEAFKDERFQHALSRGASGIGMGTISYGMWDHRTNSGYVNPEVSQPKAEITPAPPIKDGDKEWDL